MKNNYLGFMESRYYHKTKLFSCSNCKNFWISNWCCRCHFCNSANLKNLPLDFLKIKDMELIMNEE